MERRITERVGLLDDAGARLDERLQQLDRDHLLALLGDEDEERVGTAAMRAASVARGIRVRASATTSKSAGWEAP